MTENEYQRLVEKERQDRFIAEKCLADAFETGKNLNCIPTDITCSVDLYCSVENKSNNVIYFNTEIKERNKNYWQLKNYPTAELKVEKYQKMKEATPEGTKLLYMVLLNKKDCLIFDLDNIDFTKVNTDYWRVKETEYSGESKYKWYLTYFIPYSMAVKKVPCSEYYQKYKDLKEKNHEA